MNTSSKALALLVGGAFAASIATTAVHAAENPFAVKTLTSGYMVADASDSKMKDGKCSTGKCGANKKKAMEEKAHEGKCSADKKDKEGSCSAEKKAEAEKS
jgi:uncharacterized low-complexity protein